MSKITQSDIILELLRQKPMSQRELRVATLGNIMNITGRLSDLRKDGFVIEPKEYPDGYDRYVIVKEPEPKQEALL